MIANYKDILQLSREHNLNVEDILMIALNAMGAHSTEYDFPRMRFRLALQTKINDPIYTIVPTQKINSPFYLQEGHLFLKGHVIGKVDLLENDDVVVSYFRKGGKVLTLNSNVRSKCAGCSFCPNVLEKASDTRFSVLEDLSNYFKNLAHSKGWQDLSQLEIITVCTGCFLRENLAVDHLIMVKKAASENGFIGKIQILTSVIRSREAMKTIKERLGDFKLTLTVECFTNREKILKKSKADLSFQETKVILKNSKEIGFDTNFTYIVGIDSLDIAIPKISELSQCINTFPNFQVYQPHNAFMETFSTPESRNIEYFLKARINIEHIFAGTDLMPQSWENYRSLWYYSHRGVKYQCTRI